MGRPRRERRCSGAAVVLVNTAKVQTEVEIPDGGRLVFVGEVGTTYEAPRSPFRPSGCSVSMALPPPSTRSTRPNLGVGCLRDDVAWSSDGSIRRVTRMTLSLTWDQRVFDGAPAAEFVRTITRYLDDPITRISELP